MTASTGGELPAHDGLATPATAEPPEPCTAPGLSLELPETIAAVWSGSHITEGRADIVVRWCGPGPATLSSIEVSDEGAEHASAVYSFDAESGHLEEGQRVTREIGGGPQPGAARVLARALLPTGETVEADASFEVVDDPERVAAIAACDACGGTFQGRGILGYEGCDCPTSDAGARCLSSADCEGPCIFDRYEVQPAGARAFDGQLCARNEELRVAVGRCHDRHLRFGCHSRLTEPLSRCAMPGMLDRAPYICVD